MFNIMSYAIAAAIRSRRLELCTARILSQGKVRALRQSRGTASLWKSQDRNNCSLVRFGVWNY